MGRASSAFLAAGWLAAAAATRAELPDFSKTKPPPGRTFKTNQDKVNYALCRAGDEKMCAHVRYKEGPLPPEDAPAVGGRRAAAEPGAPAVAGEAPGEAPAETGGTSGGPGQTPPSGEEAAARAREGGGEALDRARGLGDALKKDLREEEAGAPGAAGRAGKAPGSPGTGSDAARAAGGASAAGSPAEAEALMRRPDFFSKLPRARFEELRAGYRSSPGDAAFKDVALSASGGAFVRSASCDKLSGECAPGAAASYRKGDAVPPEELALIHRRLRGGDPDGDFVDEGPGDDWESEAAAASPAPSGPAVEADAGAARRAPRRAVLRAVERLFGGGEAPRDNTGGPGAASAARRAWGDVPGAAIMALERGRGRLSAAGAVLFALALLLLARRTT